MQTNCPAMAYLQNRRQLGVAEWYMCCFALQACNDVTQCRERPVNVCSLLEALSLNLFGRCTSASLAGVCPNWPHSHAK